MVNNAITFGAGTWLKQKLPFSKSRMHNKRFTLAVWLTDDQIWCQSFTATAEDSYVTAPWAYQGIGSYYDGSCWTITIANLPNCTVKHVGLFDGEYTADTLPEYRSKGYGAELSECQRYYRVNKGHYLPFQSYAPHGAILSIADGPMRILPTISISLGTIYGGPNGELINIENLQYEPQNALGDMIKINIIDPQSRFIANTTYFLRDALIVLTADL